MIENEQKAPTEIQSERQETVRESITDAIEEVSEEPKRDAPSQSQSEPTLEEKPKAPSRLREIADKLPPEHRKMVIEREEEIEREQRFHQSRLKNHEELEKVLAPRLDVIKKFGTTPAQTIDKLFQWFEALGHPDYGTRTAAFRKLAQGFGVDLSASELEQSPRPNSQRAITTQNAPQANQAFLATFETELKKFASTHKHYDRVRSRMNQLLRSGAVPLIDSPITAGLDLERAYQLAVQLDKGLSGSKAAQSKPKLQTKAPKPVAKRPSNRSNETVRDSLVRVVAQAK